MQDREIDGLKTLPERMLARLPGAMRRDPQLQQEVGRVALASLAYAAIDAIGGDGDHPVFLPASGPILNIGQPNADTVCRVARWRPAHRGLGAGSRHSQLARHRRLSARCSAGPLDRLREPAGSVHPQAGLRSAADLIARRDTARDADATGSRHPRASRYAPATAAVVRRIRRDRRGASAHRTHRQGHRGLRETEAIRGGRPDTLARWERELMQRLRRGPRQALLSGTNQEMACMGALT